MCYSDSPGINFTNARQKMQDPLNALANDFVLGSSSTGKRGRNNFILTNGENDTYKLSDTPDQKLSIIMI